MATLKLRSPRSLVLALAAAILSTCLSAAPAFAYQQKTLTSDWGGSGVWLDDSLVHTVSSFVFSTSLSQGQSRNFEAKVVVDGPDNYPYTIILAMAVIGCYSGSHYYTGSFSGENWIGPKYQPNPGVPVTLYVDHLFTAPLAGTNSYSCRVGVRATESHSQTDQMRVLSGSWFRMSDGIYTDGRTWSDASNVYVGPTPGDYKWVLVTTFSALNPSTTRYISVVGDVYLTTCYSADDSCDSAHRGSGTGSSAVNGSTVGTRVRVMRLTASGASCGQTTYYPSSGDLMNNIPNIVHHFTVNHPSGTDTLNVSDAPNGSCSNKFQIAVKVTFASQQAYSPGNPVLVKVSTGMINATDMQDVAYLESFGDALTQG